MIEKYDESKISVVVPVYNGEMFLKKTINSVLNQSYKNIEIILIDDGSTDRTFQICKELERKDNRCKAYRQEHKGVSSARNFGLKKTTGRFIIFVDSDDILEYEMLKKMYINIEKEKADICCCGIKIIDENSKLVKEKVLKTNSTMNREEALIELLSSARFGISLWNKLIRIELVKDVFFEEGRNINEDKFYLFSLLTRCKKISITNEVYYNYIQRVNSLSKSKFSEKNLDILYFSKKIESEIYKNFGNLYEYAIKNIIKDYIYVYRNIVRFYSKKDKIYENVYAIKKELKKYIKKCNHIKLVNKMEAYTICYMSEIYLILLKIFDKTLRKK